jgi:hypothetical protein
MNVIACYQIMVALHLNTDPNVLDFTVPYNAMIATSGISTEVYTNIEGTIYVKPVNSYPIRKNQDATVLAACTTWVLEYRLGPNPV